MAAVLRRGAACWNDCYGHAIVLLCEALGGFKRRVVILGRRANHPVHNERGSRTVLEWYVLLFGLVYFLISCLLSRASI
jgi:hypothetical protein